jgi:translocation and assembly module TamA
LALAPLNPARAGDPQPYVVKIAATGDAALDQALKATSTLESLRESGPVGPFGLTVRARDDAERLTTVLHSYGYYLAHVVITIAGHGLNEDGLVAALESAPADPPADVRVAIEAGPLFHLGTIAVHGSLPEGAESALELKAGAPARAADVLDAQTRLLAALKAKGYALAKVDTPSATLDLQARSLAIAFTVNAGPRVDIGPISIVGLQTVNESFVRRWLLIHQGELYTPAAIEKARGDLATLDVFSSVRVRAAEKLAANSELPLTIEMTERPLHAVNLGAAWSTDEGGTLSASWTHRNLFGNAERLVLSAQVNNLGGTASQAVGYNVGPQLTIPDFLRRDQTLSASIALLRQFLDAYDQTAFKASLAIERPVLDGWIGSIGVGFEQEEITQESVTNHYTLLSLPIGLRRDNSNSLLDPTRGWRLSATLSPTLSLGAGNQPFLIAQVAGSTYLDLAEPGRSVLALRARLGSIAGAGVFAVPPDQRFYAGGVSTVRGYRFQSIGPQFPDNNPTGGTSISTGTAEFRQRFGESFGAVVFVDAGQVGTDSNPFSGQLRVGVGGGARYYTPVGPIRVDVAFPVIRQAGGDSFELYLGLGQAF